MIKRISILAGFSIFISCAGTRFVDTSDLPDTYQCTYMKDICKEASDYERKYSAMSPEEKKEFENIMKAYRTQCNDALDMCQKSKKAGEHSR
jgi:hypothetical protein